MLREAQVNSAFAYLYPSLDPGRWYTAAAIAGYVKGTRIIERVPTHGFRPDPAWQPFPFPRRDSASWQYDRLAESPD
jgi:hypothetical protein